LNNVSIITAPAMGVGLLSGEKNDLVQNLLSLALGPKDSQQCACGNSGDASGNPGKQQKEGKT
jgi:hypothetical protein